MIFFDLDGTLLDSNGLWVRIDEKFLLDRGISPVPADYLDYVTNHVPPKGAAYTKERYNLPESAEDILAQWQEMARHAYCHELDLRTGAKELLGDLKDAQVPMCLLTACLPELCHGALENHGISSYFKTIHTAIELGLDKRDKELFPLVAKLQGKDPRQCILLDDAIDYCMAAKEAGFTVIGIHDPSTGHDQEQLKEVCDYYVEDLSYISAKTLMDISRGLEAAFLEIPL